MPMTIWQERFREIIREQKALSYNLETERLRQENLQYIRLVNKFLFSSEASAKERKTAARNQRAYEETLADIMFIYGEE